MGNTQGDLCCTLRSAAQNGKLDECRNIMANGADVDGNDNMWSSTALHEACRFGHHDVAAFLLNQQANPNAEDCIGHTPLFFAAKLGCDSIVQLLLERGAIANHKSKKGKTALHLALQHGNRCSALILLSRGADPFTRDQERCSPCQRAAIEGSLKHMCLLLSVLSVVREDPAQMKDVTDLVDLGDKKLKPNVRILLDYWLRAVVRGRRLSLPPATIFDAPETDDLVRHLESQARGQNQAYLGARQNSKIAYKRPRDVASNCNLPHIDALGVDNSDYSRQPQHHQEQPQQQHQQHYQEKYYKQAQHRAAHSSCKFDRSRNSYTSGSASATSVNNSSSESDSNVNNARPWDDQGHNEEEDSDECATEEEIDEEDNEAGQQPLPPAQLYTGGRNMALNDFHHGRSGKRLCTRPSSTH